MRGSPERARFNLQLRRGGTVLASGVRKLLRQFFVQRNQGAVDHDDVANCATRQPFVDFKDGVVGRAFQGVKKASSQKLRDLGYYKAERFQEIAAKGGYFVSRLKDNIDPYIVERSGTPPCGRAIDISGKRLRDIEPGLCRKSRRRALLIPKTLSKTEREALGRGDHTALNPVRLVGCLNEETGKYHFYATNLPVSSFDPEQVASCYRTRRVIDLLFKELKSKYKLDRISSCKQHTVEILIYTALLTLVASRTIRTLILKANPELAHRFPVLRFAEVFSRHAHRILDAVFVFQGIDPSSFNLFTGTFIRQALDPNVNRNRLLDHCTDYKVRGMPDK